MFPRAFDTETSIDWHEWNSYCIHFFVDELCCAACFIETGLPNIVIMTQWSFKMSDTRRELCIILFPVFWAVAWKPSLFRSPKLLKKGTAFNREDWIAFDEKVWPVYQSVRKRDTKKPAKFNWQRGWTNGPVSSHIHTLKILGLFRLVIFVLTDPFWVVGNVMMLLAI